MKLLSTILFFSICFIPVSMYAHEEETYNFPIETKNILSQRLGSFLDTIDSYQEEESRIKYLQLREKIISLEQNYSQDSLRYGLLDLVYKIVDHKLDNDLSLTNTQILDHVIFNKNISHSKQQEQTSKVTETVEEEIEVSVEQKIIYREDLFTEELNEYEKNILAGSSAGVISLRIRADLEAIKSETVEFQFNQDIENIGLRGNLYHDGVLVGSSSFSDTDDNTLTIDNIPDFIIGTSTSFMQLEILTEEIGKDSIGQLRNNLIIVKTTFKDNTGTITGNSLGNRSDFQNSQSFNIVPTDIQVSVIQEFAKNISTARLEIIPQVGGNNDDGNIFNTNLEGIILSVSGFDLPGDVSIFNGNGTLVGSATISGSGDIFIPVSSDSISSSGEMYEILTTAQANFRISQNGILYSAGNNNYESRLPKQLPLGQQ